ncbi:MAG: hypothetical protein FD146_2830 [Anaerolineaceae bacterium]|nr:MAG: hypothetical protein FD146_2830 [Anaerolineaceae bacterium]
MGLPLLWLLETLKVCQTFRVWNDTPYGGDIISPEMVGQV